MSFAKVEIVPSGAALGADVVGVDVRRVDDAAFRQIVDGWYKHLVLRFRGQSLTDADLIAFSRRFGDLDLSPGARQGKAGHRLPELGVISNIVEDGKPIGALGAGEAEWHTDMSYIEAPPKASMLYGIEIPEGAGDTWFTNMYRAYESIPQPLRGRLDGLQLKHDATRNSAGHLRRGFREDYSVDEIPGAVHPLVVVHPETRRKCLFLGRRLNAYVMGLPIAESERLLDEIWAYAALPENTWVQKWKIDDVLLWDNRCTMHRRDAFDPGTRRLLHRTQIKAGPIAVGAAA